MTVFGLVDRLIPEGKTHSLSRYVLPGLNRTMRRAFDANGMRDLADNMSKLPGGREVDPNDLNIEGPAVLIKVAALFS